MPDIMGAKKTSHFHIWEYTLRMFQRASPYLVLPLHFTES